MEVQLLVPKGTDISRIQDYYPDIWEEEGYDDEFQSYWCGNSMQYTDDDDAEWLTYDEAVAFCGFCEELIKNAKAWIEGNGPWAQGMISRRDFSDFATTDEAKAEWKKTSDIYWAAHEKAVTLKTAGD